MSFEAPHLLALFALLAVGACSDDAGSIDAAMDTGADADPADALVEDFVPDPPVAPALPSLPCPDGWAELDVAGTPTCEPWSLTDGPGCADGEARFVGESCAPLGPPCPSDGVPTDLPTGPVLHVRGGSPAGDGSLASPFGTITEAIDASAVGDVIAVHAGTYPEAIDLSNKGVHVVGACAAETIIEAPDGPVSSAAVRMSGDVSVSRMTVRGGRPGLRSELEGTSTIRDVWVEASYIGVVVTDMGTLVADGLVVRDIVPGSSFGYGVFLNEGATLEVRRGDFANLRALGIAASTAGSALLLEDVAVRGVAAAADGSLGAAIAVQDAMTLTVRRSLIESAVSSGILAQLDAEATIEDSLVRDIDAGAGDSGFGLGAITRGALTVSRSRVHAAMNAGLIASGYQTTVTATDVVLHEIRPGNGEGGGGAGVFLDTGATVDITRVLVHRGVGAAIALIGEDLGVSIRDATCLDTLVDAALGVSGVGLDLRLAARGSVERLHVDGALAAGIVVSSDGAALDATDVMVETTRPTSSSALLGRGATIQLGGLMTCTRCEFRDTVEAGVLVHGTGGGVFRMLHVEETAANEVSGAGMGVVVVGGATGEIDGFVIQRNAVAGVQIAGGGELVLRNGVIADNPVGVNVQDAPPDQASLSDGVVYRGNGRNLDSSGLPVPAPF